jgi:hypothetical protein
MVLGHKSITVTVQLGSREKHERTLHSLGRTQSYIYTCVVGVAQQQSDKYFIIRTIFERL